LKRNLRGAKFPEDTPEKVIVQSDPVSLIVVLTEAQLCKSRSDARRMISQGAVELDGEVIKDTEMTVAHSRVYKIRVGKTRFARVRVKRGPD
jgi:tyrosyl-tRNA synthetase